MQTGHNQTPKPIVEAVAGGEPTEPIARRR